LQVESIFPARYRFAAVFLFGGALLGSVAGCHRAPGPDVVATVNGKDIQRSELDRKYQAYKLTLGDNPPEPSAEQADIVRLAILRQMMDEEILQQRAAKFNLTASDEDVNAKVTEMKAPYTQEEFDKQLKQRNQTLDDLKRDIRHALTQNKLLNKEIESKINITDSEISAYYNSHKADFNFIEPRYNIARIVVTTTPSAQAGNLQNNKVVNDTEAKRKIQALHNKLESSEDFGSVAMTYSEDPQTAPNGGDMGFVAESQLHSDLEVYNAISKLKPGQYTDILPVVDPGSHRIMAYAIYKLISRDPAGQRELSDPRTQQQIHSLLHESHVQLLKTAYFEVLHDEAKVHNYLADEILKEGAR
jgi:peptidyl-prolyl cis-trans isomerase SurA